jgi:hypothetical protein
MFRYICFTERNVFPTCQILQFMDPDLDLDLDLKILIRIRVAAKSAGAAEDPDGPGVVERDPRDALAPLGRQHLQERLYRLQRLGPDQWQTAL